MILVNISRHFRIITSHYNNKTDLFYIYYLTHPLNIATNGANGGIVNLYENLTDIETNHISYISQKLILLHDNNYKIIPFIGWDIILTKKEPYVLEGKLCPAMNATPILYNKYYNIMMNIYKNEI